MNDFSILFLLFCSLKFLAIDTYEFKIRKKNVNFVFIKNKSNPWCLSMWKENLKIPLSLNTSLRKTTGLISIAKYYTKKFRATWDGNFTNCQDQITINGFQFYWLFLKFLQLSKHLRILFHRGECWRATSWENKHDKSGKTLGSHSTANNSRFLSYQHEWHLGVVLCTGALNSKIRNT